VGGCGRTDFPGGNTEALWRSLQRLTTLPEETVVYPGHNYGQTPTSSIGREMLENPYLRCRTFEEFRGLREKRRAG
jgi:glyoxylase-like metal-dependent hydrolase (beta-lactamase superfamily II)